MIVVDASLATKWFLKEADSPAALTFLAANHGEIVGPDLLCVEVCSALVAASNMGRIAKPAARMKIAEWLQALDRGNVPLRALDTRILERGADIALALGHPLADCLYLALALETGADLATCDAKFAAKARITYPSIKLLSDYPD